MFGIADHFFCLKHFIHLASTPGFIFFSPCLLSVFDTSFPWPLNIGLSHFSVLELLSFAGTLRHPVQVHAFLNVIYNSLIVLAAQNSSTSGSYLTFLLECLIDIWELIHPKFNSRYFLQTCFFHKFSCII